MLGHIICLLRGHHEINRRRVWNDGMDMRASCRHCHTPMIRTRDDWRPFDTAKDARPERAPHPRAH